MKYFLSFCFVLFFASKLFSQDVKEVKSPSVESFQSVNYLPVNEYTGRVDVNIPIFTISLDGLEIPISLSYNTGGVKPNSISSTIGLNWSLSAGGMIVREVKGIGDLDTKWRAQTDFLTDAIYVGLGFLEHNFLDYNTITIDPSGIDGNPDMFFANSPGLNTSFIHKPNIDAMELIPKGNKIITTTNYDQNCIVPEDCRFFETIEITSPQGFIYEYSDRESYSYNGNVYASQHILGSGLPQDLFNAFGGKNNTTALKLSSITNSKTKRTVVFQYEENVLTDVNKYYERVYNLDGSFNKQIDYLSDITHEQNISKIIFPEGEIRFSYSNDRLDFSGGKRLTSIKMYDNHNTLIKGVKFNQGYFSDINPDASYKRLRLSGINFISSLENEMVGYRFTYNPGNLPKRGTVLTDFTGYYNGNSVIGAPKLYRNTNLLSNQFLPFPLSGYTALSGGVYSLEADINFAKVSALKEIYYPTGGKASFEYELNSFLYNNTEVEGGGIRVSKYQLFDNDGSIEKSQEYSYLNDNNKTSGTILFVPRFYDMGNYRHNFEDFSLYLQAQNPSQVTQNSYVGYSKVKISEANNGYQIKEFTSPKDYPNLYSSNVTSLTDVDYQNATYYGDDLLWVDKRVTYNMVPLIFTDLENRRGRLLSSFIFDNSNTLLRKIENQYVYSVYESVNTHQRFYRPSDNIYSIVPGFLNPYGIISDGYSPIPTAYKIHSQINSESLISMQSTESDIVSGESIKTINSSDYHLENSFLKKSTNILSNQVEYSKKFYYPIDSSVSSMLGISELISENRIGIPIKKEVIVTNGGDENLVSTELTLFDNTWPNTLTLEKSIQDAKGELTSTNTLKDQLVIHDYDDKGNPIEISKKEGAHTVYVWGYNKTKIIAKIENSTSNDISSHIINLQTLSNNDIDDTSESVLKNSLNSLRSLPEFSNSLITSYTYDPLVGVTSITDPNNYTSYYKYDEFKRLIRILNEDSEIIEEYKYNNVGSEEECDTYEISIYGLNDNDPFSYSYINCSGETISVSGIYAQTGSQTLNVCVKKNTGGVYTTGHAISSLTSTCSN